MNTNHEYHTPVLLKECIDGLAIKPDGVYLDGTLGGGGHFSAVAAKLSERGTAIGIDRDPQAVRQAEKMVAGVAATIIIEQARFSETDMVLKRHSIERADGILLDLGVSSHQIDSIERGFNYLSDAALDMRMDPATPRTAADLLAQTSEDDLTAILADYGEVQNPGRMARTIKSSAASIPLRTSADLRLILEKEYGPNIRIKVLAKVFQALRIAVNSELDELRLFLGKVPALLNESGRLAVIAYHSLEDRMVKNAMRDWLEGVPAAEETPFGPNAARVFMFKRITKKAIQADETEIALNRRSRSARLRIIERAAIR